MKSYIQNWFVIGLLLVAGTSFGQRNLAITASGTENGSKRVALVVGNSAYTTLPLDNPINDARAMAVKLQSLGFEVIKRENLTSKQIGSTLREFRSRLAPGAEAIFFYAGHGLQVKGVNYLPAVDADISSEEDVPMQSLEVGKVLELMEDSKTRLNLVFLDACRNNPFSRRFRSAAEGLAKVNAPSGTIMSFATRPGSVASDGDGKNGLYTEHLLAAMDQPGQPIEQVLKQVLSGVKKTSKGKQEPWWEGGIEGNFYFIQGPVTVNVAQPASLTKLDPAQVELSFWESMKGSQDKADFEEYLKQYPQGKFAGLARNRIKQLGASVTPPSTMLPSSPIVSAPPAAAPVSPAYRDGQVFRDCADCPEMVVIPGGSFMMGSPGNEAERFGNEGPQHQVNIRRFALAKTEVTQRQWVALMGSNPSEFKNCGLDCPVENVSWDDAQAYVRKLSEKTGQGYRLPSESEWEYAARGGSSSARPWGKNADAACRYANVGDQTTKAQVPGWSYTIHNCNDGYAYTAPVGSYQSNGFGLYDMIGNAWEWTEDYWHDSYTGAPSDGSAWMTGGDSTQRVLRGGSWLNSPQLARSAHRNRLVTSNRYNYIGFRPARMLP